MTPNETTLIRALVDGYRRSEPPGSSHPYNDRAQEYLDWLVKEHLPSGSGFDNGCSLAPTTSYVDRIVIDTSFHHMDENGHYDGWTDHRVAVIPAWGGFELAITGQKRGDIWDYIDQVFTDALVELVPTYTAWKESR